MIPSPFLNSEALTYIHAFYPAPNLGPGGNTFPNFAGSSSRTITSNQFGVGADHTFANSDTLSGKSYYMQADEIFPTNLKLGPGTVGNHARVTSLAYTHLFNPTLLARFHYGYAWTYLPDTNKPGGESLLNAINAEGILPVHSGIPILPQIGIGPRLSGTSQFAVALGPMRTHEFTADIQKVRGSHTLSAGVLYFRIHAFDDGFGTAAGFDQFPSSAVFESNSNVSSTEDGLASMPLNLPSSLADWLVIPPLISRPTG